MSRDPIGSICRRARCLPCSASVLVPETCQRLGQLVKSGCGDTRDWGFGGHKKAAGRLQVLGTADGRAAKGPTLTEGVGRRIGKALSTTTQRAGKPSEDRL